MKKPRYPKLYIVNPKVQKESIDAYCFGACGKILVGGIDFLGGLFFACKKATCPYLDDQKSLGLFELAESGKQRIVSRKLKIPEQLSFDFRKGEPKTDETQILEDHT